jgi:hypothetical protein
LQIIKQIPIDTLIWIKRSRMATEVLTGFDSRKDFTDRDRSSLESVYQSRIMATARWWEWTHKTGIDLNLNRVNQHQDGSAAVIPELAMKAGDIFGFDTPYLFEIDQRDILSAENPVQLEQVKSPAQDVALRRVQPRRVELRFAGKERLRIRVTDAKFASPIVRLSHLTHRTTNFPQMETFLSLT